MNFGKLVLAHLLKLAVNVIWHFPKESIVHELSFKAKNYSIKYKTHDLIIF